jgi:hypothetical protein
VGEGEQCFEEREEKLRQVLVEKNVSKIRGMSTLY